MCYYQITAAPKPTKLKSKVISKEEKKEVSGITHLFLIERLG